MIIRDEERKKALLRAMADEYSLKILMSLIDKADSVINISRINDIPIATAYRRVSELQDAGLLVVERGILTEDGKRYDLYRSAVRSMQISFRSGQLEIDVTPNRNAVSKLESMWMSLSDKNDRAS
ncbi:MAG: helix-turn-helix domain-containing protein [Thaumarchaeota archaeon]|nr:helix-turn-helix domain-containing protein [Nitrososphaerota archaeon]